MDCAAYKLPQALPGPDADAHFTNIMRDVHWLSVVRRQTAWMDMDGLLRNCAVDL